jgi:hypothetical protein
MLRDAQLSEIASDFYFLIGFTIAAMTVAARRFAKSLD